MTELAVAVQELATVVYAENVVALSMPPHTDLSRGNRCDRLTLDMLAALDTQGFDVRRELHQTPDGLWHYMIAHAAPDAAPSQRDVVTDLNPWQYGNPKRTGLLHGERTDVQVALAEAGAPAWFVSLRGIATIVTPHTTQLTPFIR
jgi:hypothetical protein